MAKRSRDRLSPQDWELAALQAIAKGGLSAVAAERLARSLGPTRTHGGAETEKPAHALLELCPRTPNRAMLAA